MSDYEERRRVQNRVAQKKYRERNRSKNTLSGAQSQDIAIQHLQNSSTTPVQPPLAEVGREWSEQGQSILDPLAMTTAPAPASVAAPLSGPSNINALGAMSSAILGQSFPLNGEADLWGILRLDDVLPDLVGTGSSSDQSFDDVLGEWTSPSHAQASRLGQGSQVHLEHPQMTSDLLVDAIRNKGRAQDQQISNSEILVHQKALLGKQAQHHLTRFVATYRLGMALQIFPADLSLIHTLSAVISRLESLQKP